ncbi:MAG: hypothetical protein H6657_17010 [Ardenticatenaceae bacterium]|nr:hypothetical protein [Ardenticatenaceae bacterium]
MSYPVLYQWIQTIATHLPCLNSWQVENVGLFTIGIMRAESCQQQQIARQVATGEKIESCARRLRRFLDNALFPLHAFFAQWTAWIVSQLPLGKLYLLVDETKLQDRLAVMVVGVAWEGRCIPWHGAVTWPTIMSSIQPRASRHNHNLVASGPEGYRYKQRGGCAGRPGHWNLARFVSGCG